MIMETLISRGGYPIHYRINGFNYEFRRNDDGHFVCPVLSGEHVKMMLTTGNFRVYVPEVPVPVHPDVPLITTSPREEAEPDDAQGEAIATDEAPAEQPPAPNPQRRSNPRRKKA